MGYTAVPICTPEDGKRFVEQLRECEPISKITIDAESVTFEDERDINFVSLTKKTSEALCEITEDPEDSTNNVLYFVSGTAAAQADTLSFKTAKHGANCNVLETKMYISSATDNGYLFQIKVGNSYIMRMDKSGKTVSISDITNTDGRGTKNPLAETVCDKWFTLRVEYYHHDEVENELEIPKIKIFIDGEYVTTSENYKNADIGASPLTDFSGVDFYSMRLVNTYVYFDDCYFATETKIYSDIDHTVSDSRDQ